MNHYLKTTVLLVVFGTMTIFSKTIQKETIKNYNKCIGFMSSNTSNTVSYLGV